jgi:histidine triad (HIT) family protein
MKYDSNNVFYKIINGQAKADMVLEGEYYIAINDISPKAPVHILVIPKNSYIDYNDFATNASDAEIIDFTKGLAQIIKMKNLEEGGFRLISNSGTFGQQEVMHMHMHILGDVAKGR